MHEHWTRDSGIVALFAMVLGYLLGRPPSWLPRLWVRMTYWQVPCADCGGTGVCKQPGAKRPHSCCGDCARKRVSADQLPPDFDGVNDDSALIGDGIMWRRPWSRRQLRKPSGPQGRRIQGKRRAVLEHD